MDAVLSQLAAIAKERRERKQLPVHAVSRETTVGDDAVRKFEGGQQGQNIDRMANAYAAALGVSVFDLWDEAIARARKADSGRAGAKGPADRRAAAQEAERVAGELEQGLAGATPRSRSTGKRTARSARGSRKK